MAAYPPWAHGEARNGGFPDWLVAELGHNGLGYIEGASREHETRTNDALYVQYVEQVLDKACTRRLKVKCARMEVQLLAFSWRTNIAMQEDLLIKAVGVEHK